MNALLIHLRGTVQGVGFRPFVYRIATQEGLRGFVRNSPEGVELRVEGGDGLQPFLDRLRGELPPLARIDEMQVRAVPPLFVEGFHIDATRDGGSTVFAPADLFMCKACRAELQDPADRRHLYPFINCTDCGPRYTLLTGLPYDREKTTMRAFPMCKDCGAEYRSPGSRRFHAEPNACAGCGPALTFIEGPGPGHDGNPAGGEIGRVVAKIREGKIVALKGLGGFHLVCDPFHPGAVARLRALKNRARKPLALMARDAATAAGLARVGGDELRILESASRPIVLLAKKTEIDGISPDLDSYGIMLPYTPLHFLLLQEIPVVVATSANEREGPILKDEGDEVAGLADCILTHNRPIANRCDDSVVKVFRGEPLFLRRARGYVPDPLWLPGIRRQGQGSVLALGAEMKNTVTLFKGDYLVTSQYLGDMKDVRNLGYLEEALQSFRDLYCADPEVVCCDLHPKFSTTRLAERFGVPVVRVQHHVAHAFAVMAEHGLDPREPCLGVAFDGMGYGEDGRIWGGEFFILSDGRPRQRWHFRYVPQPGGDLASREPWRMALSYLRDATGGVPGTEVLRDIPSEKIRAVTRALDLGINAPATSSVGRLFDAVAALAGLAPERVDYEAEAAMRLERAVDPGETRAYTFSISGEEIDVREMIREILRSGEPPEGVAAKFHNTLARIIVHVARITSGEHGIRRVLLSGGVFLNTVLLERTVAALEEGGFDVRYPHRFSPGDEAISAGQALYAASTIQEA